MAIDVERDAALCVTWIGKNFDRDAVDYEGFPSAELLRWLRGLFEVAKHVELIVDCSEAAWASACPIKNLLP